MNIARFSVVLGMALVAAGWQILPALAQPAPATPPAAPAPANTPATPPTPTGATPPAVPPQPITADVSGFRSARFGMTQDQVREAIKADFGIEDKDIRAGANDQEKTKFLMMQVANLVPDSGTAVVTYIFGFASQKLIQVNVVWGKLAQQEIKPTELVATGKLLQQYFIGQGFARDTMTVGATTNTGSIILFNGFDERKRSVNLVLIAETVPVNPSPPATPQPSPGKPATATKPDPKAPPKPADVKPGEKKPPEVQLVVVGLRLSYIENASNPDVFRIQRGKF
jgi:hypothetical protein